jgi:hypothetical protein
LAEDYVLRQPAEKNLPVGPIGKKEANREIQQELTETAE